MHTFIKYVYVLTQTEPALGFIHLLPGWFHVGLLRMLPESNFGVRLLKGAQKPQYQLRSWVRNT